MAITSPLTPTFPMTPVTPSNITFPWSVGLGLGFHSPTTGEAAAFAQQRHQHQQQQQIQDNSNDSIDVDDTDLSVISPADANEDIFEAMDIHTTNNVNLEDMNIDLGMNINFDDEAVTGVRSVGRADDYVFMASLAPAAAAMVFTDDVVNVEVDANRNGSNGTLIPQNQQAGLTGSTAISDVELEQILSKIDVGNTADYADNNENYANADGVFTSGFTALLAEEGANDFFNTLNTDNITDVTQKNPTNADDDILLNPINDGRFLSSLNNIDFDPSNLLNSDSLTQQPGHGDFSNAIFPRFNSHIPQVNINQPASATLSNKSNGSSNSNSTDQKSPIARCHNFTAEKPKYDLRHPWVRVNDTTKGKNNRSGKINQYNPTALYKVEAEPLKNWRGNGYRFKYNHVGELAEPTYSADQIKTYLYNFQTSAERKLKLWIQRAPADSARRYANPESSKCRFRDCPSRRMMNGTIMHGHFRVAFDERWNRYGDDVDPFAAVSGYAHLYCMERFLDFADVCAKLDVEVDTRSLSKEPRHRWAAGLNGTPECETAHCFIKKCRSGLLEPEFPNYPLHEEGSLARKRHEQTLTFGMHNARYRTLRPKRLREAQSEAPKTSTLYIHFGDVERFCIGRLAERKRQSQNQNQNQVNQSRSVSHTLENGLTQRPEAHISSSPATQAITGTLVHPPINTIVTSNTPFLRNTSFPNIDTIMKDASAQTDVSLPPPQPQPQPQSQHPTRSSTPFPMLFPFPYSVAVTDNTTQTNTLTQSSDLKRKRSFHRPDPIRTDLQSHVHVNKRPRSRSSEAGHGHGQDETVSCRRRRRHHHHHHHHHDEANEAKERNGMSVRSAQVLNTSIMNSMDNMDNMDEPLSAMMRGLLNELADDDDDDDGKDDINSNARIPHSAASLDSLFES